MRFLLVAAAFALAAPASLPAQTTTPPATQPAAPDFTYAIPIAGSWTFAPAPDGSAATFLNASAMPQLTIRCARATRRVSIAKPGSVAVPLLYVWTSTMTRGVPASFDPATARITIQIPAYDPLLDALAFSRGRIAIYAANQPALVVPAWPELARVVEDCRY
jgi:hypothetical protein